ncbi:CIA30 family protein [Planctomycetota bacterium]
MKYFISITILAFASLFILQSLKSAEKKGSNPRLPDGWYIEDFGRKEVKFTITPVQPPSGTKQTIRIESNNPNRFKFPAFAVKKVKSSRNWRQYRGISFWVKGNGSKYYASIILGVYGPHSMSDGYEAFFPLKNKNWHKVSLRWEDFVQNSLPWDKKAKSKFTLETVKIDPAKVIEVGFGHGRYFFDYNASYTMEIAGFQLERALPEWKAPDTFSIGLSRTRKLLASGKPLKILALGDSITWRGKKRAYSYYLGTKLKEKYGSSFKDCNRGIAGYSIRGGAISLPRDIRAMPDPDLVLVFFGANDCKAVARGLTAPIFAAQTANLVDRIRIATNGQADILILSGVPRGIKPNEPVGKIVTGLEQAAKERKTGFCDTYTLFKNMKPNEHKKYSRDGVHLNDAGQKIMAELVFKRICELCK